MEEAFHTGVLFLGMVVDTLHYSVGVKLYGYDETNVITGGCIIEESGVGFRVSVPYLVYVGIGVTEG